jgi:tetratricopeptide (TPR) repeat protein
MGEPGLAGRNLPETGRYNDALTDFNRVIEPHRSYQWAIGERGRTYRLMGRYDEALTDFSRAIELSPGYQRAAVEHGIT